MVVGFSETLFNNHVTSNSIIIPGYSWCRTDRSTRRDSGVALRISGRLRVFLALVDSVNENIFIKVDSSKRKLLIGVIYLLMSTPLNAQSVTF